MENNTNNTENKVVLGFAALYPELQENIPSSCEKKIRGKDFISYGDDNKYPDFLYSLYLNCATLQSIINGICDYILGNGIIFKGEEDKVVNGKGETISEVAGKLMSDYLIYGHFYVQVLRNKLGQVSEIYWIDASHIRTNEDNSVFFYSEDWSKSYGRVQYLTYPKFIPTATSVPTSVIMVKSDISRGTYGTPIWSGAIKSALIETKIEDFHLNEISNNFLGSCIVNFNNGRPSDEQKDEIERNMEEKFSGSENAGRFMLSFNESEQHRTTVERLGTDDFDSRYKDLASRTRDQLFVAFRAIPLLFGLTSESNTGFSTEEFEQSFKLFNRTVVRPIQKKLIRCVDKLFGDGSLVIDPFELTNGTESNVENEGGNE